MERSEYPQQSINQEGERWISAANPYKQEILAAERKITEALVESTRQAEHAPAWIKEISRKVADAWFNPKSFESEKVYEKLGTRIYKKILPTSGDYVMRRVYKRYFGTKDLVKPNKKSLKDYEKMTRALEGAHLLFFCIDTLFLAATQLKDVNLSVAAFIAGVNVLTNAYPIMVQRYNRIRLFKAISKMEAREARAGQSEPKI